MRMRMGHLRIYEIDYKLKTMWDGGVKLSFPHPLHTALVGWIAHMFELDLHSNLKYTCKVSRLHIAQLKCYRVEKLCPQTEGTCEHLPYKNSL